ncbi:hypothetical protein DIPPA_22833 [Diplonema papillatum]|nr:hypothetical protein DIPPA_22833 [Diplonema papillatum]
MQRVVKLFALPTRDGKKDAITALDCKENVVFIGSGSGLLQKWRLDQDPGMDDYVSRQLNQVLLKKRPVLQLIIDQEWPRLFALCDEMVTVHSTNDLTREFYITEGDGRTNPLKGCTCIAVAPVHRGVHRVCVATKRRLHLYTYKLNEGTHTLFQVLVMPSSVCCLAFQGETLCCGYTKEYSLLNCYSGEATGLFTLANQQPYIKSLGSEQAALCSIGSRSVRVSLKDSDVKNANAGAHRITRETIRWSAPPRSLGFKHPYIVALLPDKVEVYSIYEGEIVQALTNLTKAVLSCWRCPGPQDNLCIATETDVYMLVATSIEDQLKTLVNKLMMTEAFDLLYRTSTGDEAVDALRMKQTHIDAGFAFLFRGQSESAFEHFAATDIDVREILLHLPHLLPANAQAADGVLHGWSKTVASNDVSVPLETRYRQLFVAQQQQQQQQQLLQQQLQQASQTPTAAITSAVNMLAGINHSASSVGNGSLGTPRRTYSVAGSVGGSVDEIIPPVSRVSLDGARPRGSSIAASNPRISIDVSSPVENLQAATQDVNAKVTLATNMLLLFIMARRDSADPVQQRCMDYASLVVAIQRHDTEEMYTLLSNTNYCDLRECAPVLRENGLYRELALLYANKKRYTDAAQALQQADRVRAFADGEAPQRSSAPEDLQTDLQEIFMAVTPESTGHLKKILARGVAVNTRDSMGNTPLHYASALADPHVPETNKGKIFGDPNQVSLLGILLSYSADPLEKNSYGLTPLDVALRASTKTWGLLRAAQEINDICTSIQRLSLPSYATIPDTPDGSTSSANGSLGGRAAAATAAKVKQRKL